jgi:hypothetical protein
MKTPFVGNVLFVRGNVHTIPAVLQRLEEEGVAIEGNVDLSVRHVGTFGIVEARELGAKAAMRAVVGKHRYFVVATDAITNEAQNALLKTLEEPPADAVFIFIHPTPQMLLPTVRSRAQLIEIDVQQESLIDVSLFLNATPPKRLDILKPLLEKGDDDKRDFGSIISFLSALEKELHSDRKRIRGLHAVYRARRYIGDRGALVKPLLEHVALLL